MFGLKVKKERVIPKDCSNGMLLILIFKFLRFPFIQKSLSCPIFMLKVAFLVLVVIVANI